MPNLLKRVEKENYQLFVLLREESEKKEINALCHKLKADINELHNYMEEAHQVQTLKDSEKKLNLAIQAQTYRSCVDNATNAWETISGLINTLDSLVTKYQNINKYD